MPEDERLLAELLRDAALYAPVEAPSPSAAWRERLLAERRRHPSSPDGRLLAERRRHPSSPDGRLASRAAAGIAGRAARLLAPGPLATWHSIRVRIPTGALFLAALAFVLIPAAAVGFIHDGLATLGGALSGGIVAIVAGLGDALGRLSIVAWVAIAAAVGVLYSLRVRGPRAFSGLGPW